MKQTITKKVWERAKQTNNAVILENEDKGLIITENAFLVKCTARDLQRERKEQKKIIDDYFGEDV